MSIFLIRHGETEANAERIVQVPEVPLNPRGMAQGKLLAQRLQGEGITRIVSSHLVRAVMTAKLLEEATDAEFLLDPGLQERNFGELRGLSYASIGTDIMAEDYLPPGGEGWREFHNRVDEIWPRITTNAQETEGNLAVVTHGLVCYSLALRHLQLPPGEEAPRRWGNSSLTLVDGAPPWQILLLNCTEHLQGEAADDSTAPAGV